MIYGHIIKRIADCFQSHGSLKLSFTSIQFLCLNFVECKFFLESKSQISNIKSLLMSLLYMRNLDDSIHSGSFSMSDFFLCTERILLLMHGLVVHVKEGINSRKLCRFLCIFSNGFTSLNVLLLFPLSITFLAFMLSFWCYFI